MKKIAFVLASAGLMSLAACNSAEAPVEENNTTEAVEAESLDAAAEAAANEAVEATDNAAEAVANAADAVANAAE